MLSAVLLFELKMQDTERILHQDSDALLSVRNTDHDLLST